MVTADTEKTIVEDIQGIMTPITIDAGEFSDCIIFMIFCTWS
jgi:hypothetical protein